MIRQRLLVWFVLLALLPVISVGVGTSIVSYHNGRQQSIDRLESVAARKELAILGWAQSLQQELLFASQTSYAPTLVGTALRLGNEEKVYPWYTNLVRKQLQALVVQSAQLDELFLIDLQGEVIVSTNLDREGVRYAGQPSFERGLAGPYTHLPFLRLDSHQIDVFPPDRDSVVIVVPVFDPNGQVNGIMGGRAAVESLHALLDERTGLGETGKNYLVDSNYAPLVGSYLPSERTESGGPVRRAVRTRGIEAALQRTPDSPNLYTDPLGISVIGVTRWLPELQAVLSVEQDRSEAFRAVSMTMTINLVIALAAVCIGVAASHFVRRSIAGPIENLAATASLIAQGDLHRAAKVERADEIGALALAFNSMTAQLSDLIGSLENRVEERTRALQDANRALEQRALQLQTSAQVGREITSILDIDKLLTQVVETIREAFGYYHVQVFLMDREADELVLHAGSDGGNTQHRRLALDMNSVNARAARTGEAVLVNDVARDPGFLAGSQLPETRSELVIPLQRGNQVIGTLDVHNAQAGAFSAEDIVAIQSLGDQIVVAIENARLYDQSRELAVLEERTRLARDLHDSVTQSLYSLVLLTEGWRRLLNAGTGTQTEEYLGRIGEIAQQALQEMRLLIHELRPPALEQEGLVGAVRKRLDAVERRVGTEARVVMDELLEVPASVEEGLYWITQEALNNALKHAAARNEIVRICVEGESLVLEIADDGHGFDVLAARHRGGIGLDSMRQRARAMGGTFTIQSAPDQGTTVTVRVPLPTDES